MIDLLRPIAVITAHMNADYDAVASMVAVHKLYPEAVIVAPSMLERRGRHDFTESIPTTFRFYKPSDCDFRDVSLLVVVDTHQKQRLDHVKEILSAPNVEIHVYDHHPNSDNDLIARKSCIKEWGATTSIVTHILREQGITLTKDEATMLGLGIFEDTGSFTFTSTTQHDFSAAAFLSGQGLDLSVIAELMSSTLTREQISILNTLLGNAVTHTIQGVPITLTEIVLDDFIGDFASLVHQFIDMESPKVLFALAVMGDRIHMIARSRVPEVDVGQICTSFGGGGHSFAASASIKNLPLAEVKGELLALLASVVSPHMVIGKHMSSPAVTVYEDTGMHEAEGVMNRFGLKALPVLKRDDDACIGILELHTAARATAHKLGHLPVADYMQRNVNVLTPETDLYEAMEIILRLRQRLIPIVENNKVAGVLTRTDIIRLLVDDTLHIPEGTPLTIGHRERNVTGLVRAHFPEPITALLETAGKLGDELGMSVFAVGGFVRDLLLRQSNFDIDLSVEGDGIRFAEILAERLGGRIRPHHKFKTAIVFYSGQDSKKHHLDVATARLEYYESPAALPTVELASIKMDLYRRDFTINALAVQLNENRFGTLIDPFGAQRDMKEKTISALHSLSFIEDPTRILRAVRFERRFNFRISVQTERLIKNALSLNMVDRLSGARLFNELKHVFDEREVPSCLRRMDGWNLLYLIHPTLRLNPVKDILISNIDEVMAWYKLLYKTPQTRNWIVYLLGLCSNGKYVDIAEMLDRLGFIERAKHEFLSLRENVRKASGRLAELDRNAADYLSNLYDILAHIDTEGLLFLMARHGQENNIGQDVSLFLTRLKDVTADISGVDLEALGETPGPKFGHMLREALRAKLDGRASTREEQLAFVTRRIMENRGSEGHTGEVLRGRT